MKNVLIVDDHFLVNIGLEILVRKVVKRCTVQFAGTFEEALEVLKRQQMDLMVLDLNIPGGTGPEMIEQFRRVQEDIRVLVCSGRDELSNAPDCINAGAYGFLSKNSSDREAETAVELVMHNKKYVSPAVQLKIVNDFMYGQKEHTSPVESLTAREKDVLDLLLKGKSGKDISNILRIKFSTVSTHKIRIFQKLSVENSMELFKKMENYSNGANRFLHS